MIQFLDKLQYIIIIAGCLLGAGMCMAGLTDSFLGYGSPLLMISYIGLIISFYIMLYLTAQKL